MPKKDRDSILSKLDRRAGVRSGEKSLYGGNSPTGAVPNSQQAMKSANNFLEKLFAFSLDGIEEVFGVHLTRTRSKWKKGRRFSRW